MLKSKGLPRKQEQTSYIFMRRSVCWGAIQNEWHCETLMCTGCITIHCSDAHVFPCWCQQALGAGVYTFFAIKDDLRLVQKLVQTHLSYLVRKLSQHKADHKWLSCFLPCSRAYTRRMHMCSCRAGNASATYDYLCALKTF